MNRLLQQVQQKKTNDGGKPFLRCNEPISNARLKIQEKPLVLEYSYVLFFPTRNGKVRILQVEWA